ncbi:MAG: EpsG family protein [Lachnospiraceae bacterium]|nr:EpsG family protein [Lachnospiraceae bacterium]
MSVESTHIFYIAIIVFATLFAEISNRIKNDTSIKIRFKNAVFCIERPKAMVFLAVSFFIVFLPLAVRNCGMDLKMYYIMYTRNGYETYDYLYFFLCKIIYYFTEDPKTGMAVIGFITLFIIYYVGFKLRKQLYYPLFFMGYFMVLYFYTYNYIRMMLAASIVILGYKFILEEKRTKAIFTFLIAIGFHFSAICVLTFYLLIVYFIKYRRLIIGGMLIVLWIFLQNANYFFEQIKFGRYLDMIKSIDYEGVSIGIGTTIKMVPLIIILFLFKHTFTDNKKLYNLFCFFTLYNVVISFVGYYEAIASRMANMYLVFSTLFLVPYIIQHEKRKKTKLFVLKIGYVFFCAFLYYQVLGNFRIMKILPYY